MIKNQEIQDKNTGVHLAIGTHATKKDATTGQELDPRHYVRITVPATTGGGEGGKETPQKISTVYFGPEGDVLRIDAHDLSPPPVAEPRQNDLATAGATGAINDRDAAQKAAAYNERKLGDTQGDESFDANFMPAWATAKEDPPQAYFAPAPNQRNPQVGPVDPPSTDR
jgi:hypothetical protein